MSNGSPTAYLLWAILSSLFFVFLLFHIWAYDRFKCIRWGAGRQPGAFKRVMTYSYIATLPLLVIFGVSLTAIKFREGFLPVEDEQAMPVPFSLYKPENKRWLLPLFFVFSAGWALEIVTHLEELVFWIFLQHQGPRQREWFESWEFRTWYMGTIVAILGMPLTVLTTRRDIDTCIAYIFLVGSIASTTTTLCFLHVLFRFPSFIRQVKSGGADPDVVARLTTFYELNLIRVVFRFMFTLPLLVIGLDAIQGHHRIIANPFCIDFLLMIGGIGCFVSSAITLLVFFPRSASQPEKVSSTSPSMSAKTPVATTHIISPIHAQYPTHDSLHPHEQYRESYSSSSKPCSRPISDDGALAAFRYPVRLEEADDTPDYDEPDYMMHLRAMAHDGPDGSSNDNHLQQQQQQSNDHPYRHADALYVYKDQDRSGKPSVVVLPPSTEGHEDPRTRTHFRVPSHIPLRAHRSYSHPTLHLHPYVMNFTSPIDLSDYSDEFSNAV